MKPKQWLFDNGHITVMGKGRMSLAHIALIEEAVRDGVIIDGYAVSSVQPKTDAEKSSPKVEKVALGNTIQSIPDEVRSEELWTAHTSEGPIGMRTVCNGCKSSLTYCWCPHPRVWLDHTREGTVFFKPAKSPASNRKW